MTTTPTSVSSPPPVRYQIIGPQGTTAESLRGCAPLEAFSTEASTFLAALSNALMRSPTIRAFPELVALGYWMRPAALRKLADGYAGERTPARTTVLAGRGVAFHIAPSNVDTIFVYSWLVSLAAGNANILRLSRKESPQLAALLGVLNGVLEDPAHHAVRDRTLLVRYDPDPAVTGYFSSLCDVRVVWGGDTTVNEIRRVPLPPLALELVFGDRFSMAVVAADSWLGAPAETRQRAIHDFVNDTYWFMQAACSSPRLVAWVGAPETVSTAREDFWAAVRAEVAIRSLDFSARDYVSKRLASAGVAIENPARLEPEPTGDVTRLWLEAPELATRDRHCGAGLFWETGLQSLEQLAPLLDRRVQTVAHFGFGADDIVTLLSTHRPAGGDRWVPFGRALDFDHVWDGYDLFRTLSRQVVVAT